MIVIVTQHSLTVNGFSGRFPNILNSGEISFEELKRLSKENDQKKGKNLDLDEINLPYNFHGTKFFKPLVNFS